ncbi:hypothetical protein PM082_004548 [Marasmius tenuissimus]|nr:hypothetical protein PM082_004548 [Marasmius tenuissimus]
MAFERAEKLLEQVQEDRLKHRETIEARAISLRGRISEDRQAMTSTWERLLELKALGKDERGKIKDTLCSRVRKGFDILHQHKRPRKSPEYFERLAHLLCDNSQELRAMVNKDPTYLPRIILANGPVELIQSSWGLVYETNDRTLEASIILAEMLGRNSIQAIAVWDSYNSIERAMMLATVRKQLLRVFSARLSVPPIPPQLKPIDQLSESENHGASDVHSPSRLPAPSNVTFPTSPLREHLTAREDSDVDVPEHLSYSNLEGQILDSIEAFGADGDRVATYAQLVLNASQDFFTDFAVKKDEVDLQIEEVGEKMLEESERLQSDIAARPDNGMASSLFSDIFRLSSKLNCIVDKALRIRALKLRMSLTLIGVTDLVTLENLSHTFKDVETEPQATSLSASDTWQYKLLQRSRTNDLIASRLMANVLRLFPNTKYNRLHLRRPQFLEEYDGMGCAGNPGAMMFLDAELRAATRRDLKAVYEPVSLGNSTDNHLSEDGFPVLQMPGNSGCVIEGPVNTVASRDSAMENEQIVVPESLAAGSPRLTTTHFETSLTSLSSGYYPEQRIGQYPHNGREQSSIAPQVQELGRLGTHRIYLFLRLTSH